MKEDSQVIHEWQLAVVIGTVRRSRGNVFGIFSLAEIPVGVPFCAKQDPVADVPYFFCEIAFEGQLVAERLVIQAHGVVPIAARNQNRRSILVGAIVHGHEIAFLLAVQGDRSASTGILLFRLAEVV